MVWYGNMVHNCFSYFRNRTIYSTVCRTVERLTRWTCLCVYCTVYCMVVRMYGMVGCTTVRMDVEKYSI